MPSLSFNVLHCNFVLILLPRYLLSISEELLKPLRRSRGIARCVLKALVLFGQSSGFVAIAFGQLDLSHWRLAQQALTYCTHFGYFYRQCADKICHGNHRDR